MADLKLLTSLGELKQFSKGQTVFFQNEAGEEMYIVLKGMFGVYINTFIGFPNRVAEIKQGSFFGEMSVIDGSLRSATITAGEESTAIVIKKENFGLLLEKSPEIAMGIMDTMRNRVTATAEVVRSAGKKAPELPPILKIVKYRDAESSIAFLTMLSEKIRQMNELLMTSADEKQPLEKRTIEEVPVSGDTIKLLPEDYKQYNITDNRNNKDNLRVMEGVCPYCLKALKAYVPVYSSLIKSNETLDGRVIYSNFNILLYTNTICPNCNYADTYLEFSKPRQSSTKPRYEGNQFENEENFTGYDRSQNRTVDEAILSYYLNIDCLKSISADPLRFANAWIRLHWLYDDLKNRDFAKTTAAKAMYYYSRYAELSAKTMIESDRMRLNAILGEMSFALEEYDRARKFYEGNLIICKDTKNKMLLDSKKRIEELKKAK